MQDKRQTDKMILTLHFDGYFNTLVDKINHGFVHVVFKGSQV